MPKDLEKLKERVKALSDEEKNALRDALQEDAPDSYLHPEEITALREILKAKKEPRKKSFIETLFE